MKTKTLLFGQYVLFLLGTLLLFYFFCTYCIEKGLSLHYSAVQLAIFQGIVSFFLLQLLWLVSLFKPTYTAYSFLGTFLVRLIALVLFMLPLVHTASPQPLYEGLFIFLPYLFFIGLEAHFALRLNNLPLSK